MKENSWKKVKLGDVANVSSSKRIFANEYVSYGIPFYRGKEIVSGVSRDKTDNLFITAERFQEVKESYGAPKKGDLLLTSVGTLGVPYYVRGDHDFYFKDGNLTWFKEFSNINSRWLYYWLKSNTGKYQLRKSEIGSSQKAYTIKNLVEMEIFLPPEETQTQIASIISTYDDLIENNEKRIKVLEDMAQRLYTEWFVKFKFPGHESVKMVDSGTEYGEIPEGWELEKFQDAIEVKPRLPYKNGDIIKHIGMDSISETQSIIDINLIEVKNKSTGIRFQNGDTLLARITPCLQNGKTAYVNFLEEDEIATGSTEFIVLRENELTSSYIYFLSRNDNFRESARYAMVGASGRQRIHGTFFDKYQVLVPDKELLLTFETKVQGVLDFSSKVNFMNNNLKKKRDLLIENLVTGKRLLKDE